MSSLPMTLVKFLLGARGKPLAHPDAYRKSLLTRATPTVPPVPRTLRVLTDVQEDTLDGHTIYTLTPRDQRSDWHIIYTHGGAYVNEFSLPHWWIVEALIRATGATITVPIYPLAPQHTFRDAYPWLTRVYRRVLDSTPADRVVLAGDSAGGGLALGQALLWRDEGVPLPARLVLFSPWVDATMSNPGIAAVEPRDVMLAASGLRVCADFWAGGDDLHHPLLSPIYANLRDLPPTDIYQGIDDVFIVDARKFELAAHDAEVSVRLYEYRGAFHVFMGAVFTPEAQDVFQKVGASLGQMPDERRTPRKRTITVLTALLTLGVLVCLTRARRAR